MLDKPPEVINCVAVFCGGLLSFMCGDVSCSICLIVPFHVRLVFFRRLTEAAALALMSALILQLLLLMGRGKLALAFRREGGSYFDRRLDMLDKPPEVINCVAVFCGGLLSFMCGDVSCSICLIVPFHVRLVFFRRLTEAAALALMSVLIVKPGLPFCGKRLVLFRLPLGLLCHFRVMLRLPLQVLRVLLLRIRPDS